MQADSLYQVPDPDRTNNTLAATGPLAVQPACAHPRHGQPPAPSPPPIRTILPGHRAGRRLAGRLGRERRVIRGSRSTSAGGPPPTPYNDQFAAAVPNQPNQTVVVPQVLTAGTYYILADSVSGAAATAGFTLTATQTNALTISALSSLPAAMPATSRSRSTAPISTPTATASLNAAAAPPSPPSAIDFVSASQLFATFNLTGAAPGNYTLSVQQGSQAVTAPTPFQVVAATAGTLTVTSSVPKSFASGGPGTIVINYTNTTNNDIVAPLLTISSTRCNVSFSTPDDPNNYVQSAQLLAVAPSGPAGILRPGQSGQLTLTLLTTTPPTATVPRPGRPDRNGPDHRLVLAEARSSPAPFPTAAWNVDLQQPDGHDRHARPIPTTPRWPRPRPTWAASARPRPQVSDVAQPLVVPRCPGQCRVPGRDA